MDGEKRKLKVAAIKDGVVIDHISTEIIKNPSAILQILGLDDFDPLKNEIYFGVGVESKKAHSGKKMFIKLVNYEVDESFLNRLALISEATINIIKDWEVAEKYQTKLPFEIDFIKCINAGCVTNKERYVAPLWKLIDSSGVYQCHYCERRANRPILVDQLVKEMDKRYL